MSENADREALAWDAKRYSYKRIGTMTYRVTDRRTGAELGTVWRTRNGFSARRLDGSIAVEDYPGSRDVAASTLQHNDG